MNYSLTPTNVTLSTSVLQPSIMTSASPSWSHFTNLPSHISRMYVSSDGLSAERSDTDQELANPDHSANIDEATLHEWGVPYDQGPSDGESAKHEKRDEDVGTGFVLPFLGFIAGACCLTGACLRCQRRRRTSTSHNSRPDTSSRRVSRPPTSDRARTPARQSSYHWPSFSMELPSIKLPSVADITSAFSRKSLSRQPPYDLESQVPRGPTFLSLARWAHAPDPSAQDFNSIHYEPPPPYSPSSPGPAATSSPFAGSWCPSSIRIPPPTHSGRSAWFP